MIVLGVALLILGLLLAIHLLYILGIVLLVIGIIVAALGSFGGMSFPGGRRNYW